VYWPEVRRGSERFLRELADGLLQRGHAPRLITSHRGRRSDALEDGMPVTRVWRPPDAFLRRHSFEDHMTHVPLAYRAIRAGADDVVHALYPTDALAAARWTARTGRPSVLGWMGLMTREWLVKRRLREHIVRRVATRCSAVTVLSKAAADGFRRILGIEPRVIPPGVNLATFGMGHRRTDDPTIFCAAAIDQPQKRVDLLIRSFRAVRRERPRARLLLSRPRDGRLAAAVADPDAAIELVDVDDRDRLAEVYATSWVSVLPSRTEAFGLVLLEALACGTPVVGSDVGGIPEVVDRDEIGRLFPEGDETALATALLETLELAVDPATRAACRARAEELSVDRCVAEYERLYRELRDERG
jgi:phosphatidylinositol alpha-mannosyltransferase